MTRKPMEARDLVAFMCNNEMLHLGNGARDEGLDASNLRGAEKVVCA